MGGDRPTLHNDVRPAGTVYRLDTDPTHRDRGPQTYIVTEAGTVYVEFTSSNYQPGAPGYGVTKPRWRTLRDGPTKRKVLKHHKNL